MEHSGEDTICAIATPLGEGGVGIVRVSGDRAIAIATKVVQPRNHSPLAQLTSHRLYLSDVLGEILTDFSESCPLDEALVVVMKKGLPDLPALWLTSSEGGSSLSPK